MAEYLRERGHEVYNPAELPSGWTYDDYMERCLREMEEQDVICRIEGWEDSPGAKCENEKAKRLGLDVMQAEVVPFEDLYMVRVYVPKR